MRLVDVATEYPGCCELTGDSTGPFIETGRLMHPAAAQGGTQYVLASYAIELGVAAGCVAPHAAAALRERVELLEAELDAARDALVELEELRQAVGYTLKHGATARRGEVVLRNLPGRRRVEV